MQQLRLTLTFGYNATFSINNTYIDGSNSTSLIKMRVEMYTFKFDPATNVTSNITTIALFDQLGNITLFAGRDAAYMCAGDFNLTASSWLPQAPATQAPFVSITNIGAQSFIPLGRKTHNDPYADAVCPHVVTGA
jgi:hypothetical protein